ncbi:hypothetical protein [Rhizosaccharibacter radicis]|uniref:VWA domain-containing protein n=1 Tax=Rhizosaccharibacter radicis TaxID=2782605 RepID=A0ABT1VVJ4_9PROT|nr:hypothetical protein [Acetobacteraceae bacterium KSS12]
MLALARVLLVPLLLLIALHRPAWADPPVPEVFLIQNSGWMEPFFTDPSAPFRPLLRAFIEAAHRPDAPVTIASFNQEGQLGDRPSPFPLFHGALGPAALDDALARLDLPRRADGAYTDADYNGALSGAIGQLLHQQPGIIWMVTNNKNSRSNDQNVVANTSRFSALLTDSPFITRIVAYPVRMPSQGKAFAENGLVLYGIAYGAPAAAALSEATDAPAMRRLFNDPPVRLKPLTRDPLSLVLRPDRQGTTSVRERNGVLVLEDVPAGRATPIRLPGSLSSAYYPQVIASARLQAEWQGDIPVQVSVSPDRIADVAPGAALPDVRLVLTVPPIRRPPGLAGLTASGRRISGTLRIALTDERLVLQPAFVDKMRALFGSDAGAVGRGVMHLSGADAQLPASLPAVFLQHRAVSGATTLVPVLIVVRFSPWPLLGLIAVGVLLALTIAALILLAGRSRLHQVRIGDEVISVLARPFRTQLVRTPRGQRARVVGRLIGAPRVTPLD